VLPAAEHAAQMTTSSSSSSSVDQRLQARAWWPRSSAAWGILILAFAAVPAFYTAGGAGPSYLCFDDCGSPIEIASWAAGAAVLVLSPFVRSGSTRVSARRPPECDWRSPLP
jgi:hypothetical protein